MKAVLQACQEKPLPACSSCDGFRLYNGSTNTVLCGVLAQNCHPVRGSVQGEVGRDCVFLLVWPMLTLSRVSVEPD
jgi:hypothetical protein